MSFDIDLTVRRGDAMVGVSFSSDRRTIILFGPSGVGKTSVLMMVAGLLRPDHGHVRVAGRTLFDTAEGIDLPPERRQCGFVFQDARLFPHLTVEANLRYSRGRGSSIDRVARTLEIDRLLDRWPRSLSGGEARRVAIARAIVAQPRFLLLDEPLASLDRRRRDEALAVIERVRDEAGLPMLIVTHDPDEAERLGDHIVRM